LLLTGADVGFKAAVASSPLTASSRSRLETAWTVTAAFIESAAQIVMSYRPLQRNVFRIRKARPGQGVAVKTCWTREERALRVWIAPPLEEEAVIEPTADSCAPIFTWSPCTGCAA
jgi:hypothetical protein